MSYINTTISTNTDEKSFIKKFVEELTAFQGITAVVPSGYASFNAYIDAQFELISGYPTFSLLLNGTELTFKRNVAITGSTSGYTLSTALTSSTISFSISRNSLSRNTLGVRSIKVCVAAKGNITALYLGSFNVTVLSFSAVDISMTGNTSAVSISNMQDVRAIASTFSLTNDLAAVKVDRCSYTYDASSTTDVEIIKNKIFVAANSTSRMFTIADLWDVSTVPAETKLTIGGKTYFSLDAHTIMEV